MKILFLDIDGVLNAHEPLNEAMCGQIHRDKMDLLNHVLRITGAKVVLSSAWRYLIYRGEANLQGLDWLLRVQAINKPNKPGFNWRHTRIDLKFELRKLYISSDPLLEYQQVTLQVPCRMKGSPISIRFNCCLLVEALQSFAPGELTIKIQDDHKSVSFTQYLHLHLVMPMRVV